MADKPSTVRCASCEEEYKEEMVDVTPESNNVIEGFWFCSWCNKHTEKDDLVNRAINGSIPRQLSEAEMEAGAAEWDNPKDGFTE